jgi:multidrug efflux system membrane fusion protein
MRRAILLASVVIAGVVAVFAYLAYAADAPEKPSSAPPSAASSASQAPAAPAVSSGAHKSGSVAATTVTTAVAQTQNVPIFSSAVGFIEAPNVAVVRTLADGLVVQQNVTEGQTVKVGDVLFKLDDRAAQAVVAKDRAALAKDQAALVSAQKDLSRDQTLATQQSGTQQAVDQQTAVVQGGQATLQADQAQLNADLLTLSYMSVTAPAAGRVGVINTAVGNVVRASDTSADGLLTITDMDVLRASFAMPERSLDEFRNALAKQKTLPAQIFAPGDKAPRANAQLSFLDSSVDPSSGTVIAKAPITGDTSALWPGQYVTIVTQLGQYPSATTVPLIAVQEANNTAFVFVADKSGTAKKVNVTVAATPGNIAVLSGSSVQPGDHVVIEGQLRLTDGSPIHEQLAPPSPPVTATELVEASDSSAESSSTGTPATSTPVTPTADPPATAVPAAAATGTTAASSAPVSGQVTP